jgi:O-methyltransferase
LRLAARPLILRTLRRFGYDLMRVPITANGNTWKDADFYRPLFSPWYGYGEFARYHALAAPHTLVSADRLYVLYVTALNCLQLPGEFWECGVYKGGTARMLAALLRDRDSARSLQLFDTFAGMPDADQLNDTHRRGDLADTSLQTVRSVVGDEANITYHEGFIPETFAGLDASSIA